MPRSMDQHGQCYRAVLEYETLEAGVHVKHIKYFGPYDNPGPAKGLRTMWENQRYSGKPDKMIVTDRYTEISDTWRRM